MRTFAVAAFAALLAAAPAAAKTVEVKMVNKGPTGLSAFVPAYVKIAPGDTVTFVATNPSHNAQAIPGFSPPGGEQVHGKLNQSVSQVYTKPGLYGVKCLPHVSMGMVALVQVGAPVNKAAATTLAAKQPPLAKRVLVPLVAAAK